MAVKKRKTSTYDESNIRVLMGLDKVRKKPGMYMGERGHQMVWRMGKELVDNGVDEAFAGRNDTVEFVVDLAKDVYVVADHAQGIPVGKNKETGKSTLDVVFTELHGGGKFDNKAYSASAGTHGVGAACANALCETLEVWTQRDSVWYYRVYFKGEPRGKIVKKKPSKEVMEHLQSQVKKYGTIIRFIPDQSIVSSDANNARVKNKEVAKLPIKQALHWFKMIALMNPGLKMVITNAKNGKTYAFLNKGDISAVIKKVCSDYELSTVAKPFVYQTESLDVTLQWTSYDDTNLFKSYVNCSPTKDHGKHYEGFTSAMGRVLQRLKSTVAIRGKNNSFKTADALHGLVGVVNYKMSEPEFSSQTKDRLTSHVNKDVEEVLIPALEEYFDKNKTLAKTVITRALAIAKGRDELKKVMKSVSDVRKNQRGMLLPNILTSATLAKPHERELFVVEGDSAGGTAKDARIPEYQEVFKLRGKITNAMRTSMDKLMKSPVVQNFLVALGVDLKSLDLESDDLANVKFSSDKLRIGYVMIMCDADSDGGHIAVLLLSAIQRLIPSLFSEGRVFIVISPLFLTTYKDKRYFGMTLEECRSSLPKGANVNITRAKGLGEINAEDLYHAGFNPETRRLYQVKPPSDGDGLAYFEAITGSNSSTRKELLGI